MTILHYLFILTFDSFTGSFRAKFQVLLSNVVTRVVTGDHSISRPAYLWYMVASLWYFCSLTKYLRSKYIKTD